MRILLFSDLHGDRAQLAKLMETEADLYVSAGDLVTWARGLDAMVEAMLPRRSQVVLLPGNHEHESHIEAACHRYGFEALHGRTRELGEGWTLAGLGHSNPTPFDTPGEYTEETIREKLTPFAGLAGERTVLVCHCPPKGTVLDEAAPGKHLGSTAIAEHLAAHPPAWFFCGHIHEAWGRETALGPTRAINLGKQGYLLEL
jgi:uncharacterized protein